MKFKLFFIVLLVLLFVNISVVFAEDLNTTQDITSADQSIKTNTTIEKTTPTITIDSNNYKCRDGVEISIKNSSGSPLKSKILDVSIDNKKHSLTSNSRGEARLDINLEAKSYDLTVSFNGDDDYNSISKTFKIKVSKLNTKITPLSNFVVRNNYLYFHLIDSNGDSVSSKQIKIKFGGKTYTKKTKSNGRVSLKINKAYSKYSIKASFKGDKQFKASSSKLTFYVVKSMSVKIGNSKLITDGFLRVYLKQSGKALGKKTVNLLIANKKFSKKTNSEGIVVFKPDVGVNHYTVKVKLGKYFSSKNIKCYEGNVKNPLEDNIDYNGDPDIDVMPGNFVMGDENAKYTLKKAQYKEVLKRDSYCLFLHNKLTKYTFFKTKSHPNVNHIIKREKWNVIEREINKKLVKKNKHNYWPGKVTVSLKGKSYVYPEVRDAQNTGYTCGPTSASVCSQVLKNYVNEKYLAKLAKTDRTGSKCSLLAYSLEKNNFICSYFYKSTFSSALNELKNGGAALIFHAHNHYVAILDISGDGKRVLVSNSYGSYDKIPTKWLKVSYMKNKFSKSWDDSLIVKLNYNLPDSTINEVNCYYNSMGTNWARHSVHQSIGK